MYKNKIKYRCG